MFGRRREKEKEKEKEGEVSPSDDKKSKSAQQRYSNIVSSLQKEKAYSDDVINGAIAEYLQTLDGKSEAEKLQSLNAAFHRTVTVRRLCVKHFLFEAVQIAGIPEAFHPKMWAREIFLKLEIRDNENLEKESARFLQRMCSAISAVLQEGVGGEADVLVAITRKEYFSPYLWSISELNRQPIGFLPSLPELVKTLRKAVLRVKDIRSKAIDLTHILDVLATAPQRLTGVAPVILRPILESGENAQESKECLRKSLEMISEYLKWDFDTMPLTIAQLQKHPGIPLASEVAKFLPFGELYGVIINVLYKLVLSEERGFDKCEMKMKFRLGLLSFGELKRHSLSAALTIADIMSAEDFDDEPMPERKKQLLREKGKNVDDDAKASNEPLSIRDFRKLFDLVPDCYDKDGKPVPQISEKNRAHSLIANAILVPYLKGLYEARASHLDFSLSIDEVFHRRISEMKADIEKTRSLDEKRILRKTLGGVRRLHLRVVTCIQDCVGNTDVHNSLELDMVLSTAHNFGLKKEAIVPHAKTDIEKLSDFPHKRPSEARRLLDMAREAPEGVENLPPSPWTSFFASGLEPVSKILEGSLEVAQSSVDVLSATFASHLGHVIASILPIQDEAKMLMGKDENFQTVIRTVWENARRKLPPEVNVRIAEVLRETYFYTRAFLKAKHPDAICYKLLGTAKPFMDFFLGKLREVNGDDLFKELLRVCEVKHHQAQEDED